MKKLLITLMAVSLMAVPITTMGCKAPQSVIAYKSLAATQASVDTARKAFAAQYQAGKITRAKADKALVASEKFNRAYNAAVSLGITGQSPTPESVSAAATEFLILVSELIQ